MIRPEFFIYLFNGIFFWKVGKEEEIKIKGKKCCIGKIKISEGFFLFFILSLKSNLNVPAHARHYKDYVKCEGSC